ncbi:MAG: hypothetical protein KC466_04555, partial [Myxococcales bacterium]|nr:hypothetical protein [Myxococcales bacterium]
MIHPFFEEGSYLMPCTPMGFTFGAAVTFAGGGRARAVPDLAALDRGRQPLPNVEVEGPSRPPLDVYWRRDRAGAALEIAAKFPLLPNATYTVRVDLAGFADPTGPLGGKAAYTFHTLPNDATGTWVVQTWYSQVQKRARDYELYLPPGYGMSPTQRYPTLHGYVGGLSLIDNWRTRGNLDKKIDGMHQRCEVDPMMFAVPNPHLFGPVVIAGVSWFVAGDYNDWWNGTQRFETYLTREFMDELEAHWRVRTDKWGRGAIGYSLSGYGAAILSMRNPDVFGSFTAMSSFLSLRYTGEVPYAPPEVAPYWTDPLVSPHSKNTFVEYVARDLIKSLGPDIANWSAHNP